MNSKQTVVSAVNGIKWGGVGEQHQGFGKNDLSRLGRMQHVNGAQMACPSRIMKGEEHFPEEKTESLSVLRQERSRQDRGTKGRGV